MKYYTVTEWDKLSDFEKAYYLESLPPPACPFCEKKLITVHMDGERDLVQECENCPFYYREVHATMTHYSFTAGEYQVHGQKPPIDPTFNRSYNTAIHLTDKSMICLKQVYTVDYFISDTMNGVIQRIETLLTFR